MSSTQFRLFRAATLIVVVATLLTPAALGQADLIDDQNFIDERVADLAPFAPLGFLVRPDGRIFYWQKSGVVKTVKDGVINTVLDISCRVNRTSDRGLIGMTLDPDFPSNGIFYLAYVYEPNGCSATTTDAPRTQRVSRFQMNLVNWTSTPTTEQVILGKVSDPNCNVNTSDCMPNDIGAHSVDHLMFGPDGKLWVSVGDGASWRTVDPKAFERAQSLDALNGKILRVNRDGTGVPDNPFYNGNPNANRSKVVSYGLRNPFRFWVSRSGQLYVGDVGWQSFEEVNVGRGKNFGWPCFEGDRPEPRYARDLPACASLAATQVTFPQHFYARCGSETTCRGAAIVMGPVYEDDEFPLAYRRNLYFADYVKRTIWRAVLDSSGNITQVLTFATDVDPPDDEGHGPVYLTLGPDGQLYYSAFSAGDIRRIRAKSSTGNNAPVAKAAAQPTSGLSPLEVAFSSAGTSDPDGDTLNYRWEFGDGGTSTAANPTYRYVTEGVKQFTAKLTVTDPAGASATDSVKITVGSTPPTATITEPEAHSVRVGEVVRYQGRGTDPQDGELAPQKLRWDILQIHLGHPHDKITGQVGSGGEFTVEDHGDTGDAFSYLIRLTATDSSGLEHVDEVQLPVVDDSNPFVLGGATGASTSATIRAGDTAVYNLQALGNGSFSGTVSLACKNAPPASTCTIAPSSVAVSGTSAAAFSVSIRTSAALATAGAGRWSVLGWIGAWLLLVLGAPPLRRRRYATVLLVSLVMSAGLACGGGGSTQTPSPPQASTPPGSYQVKVEGTSGSATSEVTLQLTVQ